MEGTEKSLETFDLSAWLGSLDRDAVAVSAIEDGEWVDRREFIELGTQDYELEADPDEAIRYRLRVDGDGGTVERWVHYTFVESGGQFVSGRPEDAARIVVAVLSDVVADDPPWGTAETVTLSTGVLEAPDGEVIKPVNAKRVAGLEEEKRRLNRFLDTGRKDWGLKEETGILLQGPPGTGKTELVMEVCQERFGSLPVIISGPEFLSKWVGESEKMLRKKFAEARDTHHKVIYIDEIDAVTRDRSDLMEDYSARIVSQLLVLLDGVEAKQEHEAEEHRSLKVIASTNIPHIVDEALKRPGRLGARPVQFERPGRVARKAILHHYLERIYTSERGRLGDDLAAVVTGDDLDALDDIVDATEGFTGANLEDLIQESVSRVRERDLEVLELGTVREVYEENFSSADELTSIELDVDELGPVEGIEPTVGQGVFDLDADWAAGHEEPGLAVARAYFDALRETDGRDQTYIYRRTTPKILLETETDRSETNVIEAFDHADDERVCLYLENAEKLVGARTYSSAVDDLIGVINEQLLQWENDNLLVIGPMSSAEREQLTSFGT